MDKTNKKYLIFGTIFMISLIFAYLITNLVINGSLEVGANSWSIYFDNIVVDEASVEATEEATIDEDDSTQVNFGVRLETPGEYYKFTVDIVNDGSLDAMIDLITYPTIESNLIYFNASYADGTELNANDLLPAGSTYTIEVELGYNTEIESSELIEEDDEIEFTFGIDYVQADSSAVDPFYKAMVLDDTNGNGVADVGEVISINTEDFYVISNDGTNIKALAKWNLLVGNSYDGGYYTLPLENPTGLQDESATGSHTVDGSNSYPWIGIVAFSSTDYWSSSFTSDPYTIDLTDSNNNIYPYLQDYKTALEEMGAEIEDITLITYEELETLGCVGASTNSCTNAPSWVYQTAYWSGSANSTDLIWGVYSDGVFYYFIYVNDYDVGVRPVIVIDADNI